MSEIPIAVRLDIARAGSRSSSLWVPFAMQRGFLALRSSAHLIWCQMFSALRGGKPENSRCCPEQAVRKAKGELLCPLFSWHSQQLYTTLWHRFTPKVQFGSALGLLLSRSQALLYKTNLSSCGKCVLLCLDPKPTEINNVLKSISSDFHGLEIRFHCHFNLGSQKFLTASLCCFFFPTVGK